MKTSYANTPRYLHPLISFGLLPSTPSTTVLGLQSLDSRPKQVVGCRAPYSHRAPAFTIVELLIVIVVIGILATISIVAYNGITAKARDSVRANDMTAIEKALRAYDVQHDGVPLVAAYTAINYSGWDASVSADWLKFLRTEYGKMPVDPANTMAAASAMAGDNRIYFYYCYKSGSGTINDLPTIVAGYRKEDGTLVQTKFNVSNCLTTVP